MKTRNKKNKKAPAGREKREGLIISPKDLMRSPGIKNRMKMEKLLTPEEVCGMLRIKKQRLYEWVHYNRIPYVKAGRFLRFRKDQIDQWLQENSCGIMKTDEQKD